MSRPLGSKNKFGADFRAAVSESYKARGGVKWLNQLDDHAFAKIFGQCITKTVDGSLEGNLTINVRTGVTKPAPKA